jgi:tetratricopeptide (TPR) repeat protein
LTFESEKGAMKLKMKYCLIVLLTISMSALADMQQDIVDIQHAWAKANYDTAENEQERVFEDLVKQAQTVADANPGKAEPKVWQGIVLSTQAGVVGGLGALGKAKEARKLLQEAEKIDPDALNGSIYTSLGSLYYQVPGWPLGFGNDKKAEEYLKHALAVNPDGIDPNYFYGDFMLDQGKPAEAVGYFEKAMQAPARPERPLADEGRKKEIAAKLVLAKKELNY